MNTAGKITDRLSFARIDDFTPMSDFGQAAAVVLAAAGTAVSVQLRKATDAAGANAADLGAVVDGTDGNAVAQAYANELGETPDGTPFTHVGAAITGSGAAGTMILGDGRFNPGG